MRQDRIGPVPPAASCASGRHPTWGGGVLPRRPEMADVAYVLLVSGAFAVLALTVRGLQRL
jgi:hypothetical protein